MNYKILLATLAMITLIHTQVSAATAPEGKYQIDPDHSNIGFEVGHLGISLVIGRFDKFAGDISFVPGGDSYVRVAVDMTSINTKVEQRDRHLRSDTFFNVTSFPKMSFESQKVEYDNGGNPKSIQGTLTLHGQSRPLTLEVTTLGAGPGPTGETRAGFKAFGKIKRSEFGMNQLLAIAGDDVTILLNVEAIQE